MYAVIRKRQKELFRRRTIGTDTTNGVLSSNFKDISKAFGFKHNSIANNNELKNYHQFSNGCASVNRGKWIRDARVLNNRPC